MANTQENYFRKTDPLKRGFFLSFFWNFLAQARYFDSHLFKINFRCMLKITVLFWSWMNNWKLVIKQDIFQTFNKIFISTTLPLPKSYRINLLNKILTISKTLISITRGYPIITQYPWMTLSNICVGFLQHTYLIDTKFIWCILNKTQ